MKKTQILLLVIALFAVTWPSSAHKGPDIGHLNPVDLPVGYSGESFANLDSIECLTSTLDVCAGETATYSATAHADAFYFWNVTGGSGAFTTSNSKTVTWGSSGSGTVSLVVKDALGNIVKTCQWTVTIHASPQPILSASFNPGCDSEDGSDGKTTFNNPQQPDNKITDCLKACDSSFVTYSTPFNAGSTYVWSVLGAISTDTIANTATVFWGAVGSGQVSVTETNQYGCTTETNICVEIIESPTAVIGTAPLAISGVVEVCLQSNGQSQTVSFFNQSYGSVDSPIANSYWNFGDGTISLVQNPSHNYSAQEPMMSGW